MAQGTAISASASASPSAFLALTWVLRAAKPFLMASWWEPEKEV